MYFIYGIVKNQTKKQGNVSDFVYKWGFKEAIVKLTLTKTLITMMMEAKKTLEDYNSRIVPNEVKLKLEKY
jgi:hypothetical protein